MNSREKILAVFKSTDIKEIPVVASYEGIFIRDHWFDLTNVEWWYKGSGIIDKELEWIGDFLRKTGLEWLSAGEYLPRKLRNRIKFETEGEDVWRIDPLTGKKDKLTKPMPGGGNTGSAHDRHFDIDKLPTTKKEIDELIPIVSEFDKEEFLKEGKQDLVQAVQDKFNIFTRSGINSPLTKFYSYWGYEGMMMFIVLNPSLAEYACKRILNNTKKTIQRYGLLGVDAVWIEELFTDQIRPEIFAKINVPIMQEVIKEIRNNGLKSIYYYCGDPGGHLDLILQAGADAIHLEEGKKGFEIDIVKIAQQINGQCVLFGNIDAIADLQDGSDEHLQKAVQYQLKAAKINKNRFVVSTGSPITPGTTIERVKKYTDYVKTMQQ